MKCVTGFNLQAYVMVRWWMIYPPLQAVSNKKYAKSDDTAYFICRSLEGDTYPEPGGVGNV